MLEFNSSSENTFGGIVRGPGTPNLAMNTCPMNSDMRDIVPYVPTIWGIAPNGGGGWTTGGVVGTYYSNSNYTGTSFYRTDVRVDFPTTSVMPGGSLPTDPVFGAVGSTNFSAKWVGTLLPKYTAFYTLKVFGNDSLTLKINGIAVATSTGSWASATYSFVAGQSYSVELDFVKGSSGSWAAQFHWLASGFFPEEAVGVATPIGANYTENRNMMANGAVVAQYVAQTQGTPPPLYTDGWPSGDFGLRNMGQSINYTTTAFTNANDNCTHLGVWKISFNGSAAVGTNCVGAQMLIGNDDGNGRTSFTIGNSKYYQYGLSVPLSAMVYDLTTGTGYNSATNQTVLLCQMTAAGYWPLVYFTSTDRNGNGSPAKGGTAASNGLTNVVCMKPSGINSLTPLSDGTVFVQQCLDFVAPYCVLRDLASAYDCDQAASTTSPYTDWALRPKPYFNWNATDQNSSNNGGLYPPWEFKIMMANQSGKDLYINLPGTASGSDPNFDPYYTSSYIYDLAMLLKNGGTYQGTTYPGLLPHLRVYLEYCNETWNYGGGGGPPVVMNAIGAAQSANSLAWQQFLDIGGVYTPPGTHGTIWWTALRAKNISDIFRRVYGDGPMPGGPAGVNPDPRVCPLLESQSGLTFNGEGVSLATTLGSLQGYFGVPVNQLFFGAGGGWYADEYTSGQTVDQVFSDFTLATAVLPNSANGSHSSIVTATTEIDILAQFGLRVVGYEGGFDFSGGAPQVAEQQASADPRVIPYVAQTVTQYFQAGGCMPLVFEATGQGVGYAEGWGVTDGVNNGANSNPVPPKLQAYLNMGSQLPPVPTYGNQSPYLVPGTSGHNPVGDGGTYQGTWHVATPGNYHVTCELWAGIYTTATCTITATLNGQTIGSMTTPNANGGQVLSILVYLTPGMFGLCFTASNLGSSQQPPIAARVALIQWGITS